MSDGLRLWLTSSYQPRQQSQWLDSRDRPISNAVRTARVPAAAPAGPQNTTLPATPPSTLPSHVIPEAAGAPQPNPSDRTDFKDFNLFEGIDKFRSILLEYGRSIIESARREDQDQDTQDSENDILNTKERIVAYYVSTAQSLSEDIDIMKEVLFEQRGRIGELEVIAASEEEKSVRIQDLEVELDSDSMKGYKEKAEDYLGERHNFQKLWEKEKEEKGKLEAELAGIREGNKRKREKMEEVWKKMERAVEQ